MDEPTNEPELHVWFAWKDDPEIEHEYQRYVKPSEVADSRKRCESHPHVHHTTVYRRGEDGGLVKVEDA